MNDQFCFVPTGEVRLPKAGEWFGLDDGILQAMLDFTGGHNRPIYRRVPFAVVLGLVELAQACAEERPEDVSNHVGRLAMTALAAAREAGIGATNG